LFNDEVKHNWLKEHILEAQELFIPQIKKKAKHNEVPWWSKQVEAAVKIKQSAFKSIKQQIFLWITIIIRSVCRNKAKDVMNQARLDYESQLIVKTKPCHLYSYIY